MNSINISKISDFSDKLNPMLVKELRQGMRGIGFVVMFLGFQALLCFILLLTAANARPETAGNTLSSIITFFFFVATIIFQPMRGLSSLNQEIKGNTIDLLCMTRLNSWNIAYGKWLSIVSQSALLLIAIIPYLILRYFFGDMQLFAEILFLITLFIFSATLTAVAISLSATQSIFIRIVLPVGGVLSLLLMMMGPMRFFAGSDLISDLLELMTIESWKGVFTYLGILSLCIYITWFSLDFGTSMIAPKSENRATRRRLISLSYVVIIVITFLATDFDSMGCAILGSLLCIPVIFISLTESVDILPVTTAPFVRKGALGNLAKRFLYPGWASGVVFTLMLYAIIQGMLFSMDLYDSDELTFANTFFAVILFPLAVTTLFFRKTNKRMPLFIAIMVGQIALFIALMIITASTNNEDIISLFFWIPACMFYIINEGALDESTITSLSYANVLIYSLVPLFMSIPVWKKIKEAEKQNLPQA